MQKNEPTVAENGPNSRRRVWKPLILQANSPLLGKGNERKENGQKNIYPASDFASLEKADDSRPNRIGKPSENSGKRPAICTSLRCQQKSTFCLRRILGERSVRQAGQGSKEKPSTTLRRSRHRAEAFLFRPKSMPPVKVYAAERAGEDPKFNLYPSTWLATALDAEPSGPIK